MRRLPTLGRAYFGLQALAGALWWVTVFTVPAARHATLGDLPAAAVAAADVPLFVVGSALAAFGIRWAVWIAAVWTVVVAGGMVVYATVTTLGGWGALLMTAAASASIAAAVVILLGRVPYEWVTTGPFAFRPTVHRGAARILARTGLQTLSFWGLFLVVFPIIIATIESRWMLHLDLPLWVRGTGLLLLVASTALGIWSAVAMSVLGGGTPLPSDMARHLVIAGPYRFVRNPMAVAGIAQGVAVGLMLSSWLVIAYALAGSLFWNAIVRPLEEADLETRFGTEFAAYRSRVSCWIPRPGRGTQDH